MTPRQFRDLPARDQIEMIAHRREVSWRKSHTAHVERQVAKENADKSPPPGRRKPPPGR